MLENRKILVTGGPTREWLDPVRFISNPSTGKMGIALADAAHNSGAETVFIHGPVNSELIKNKQYRLLSVESTSDMLKAVVNELTEGTILIMSAAPADYTPAEKSRIKIKKGSDELILTLKKTPDILKNIAMLRDKGSVKNIFVVGFAAETHDTEKYALGKLKDKNLDMICLNDVSAKNAGFGKDTNIVTIYKRSSEKLELPVMTKIQVAERILKEIETELE